MNKKIRKYNSLILKYMIFDIDDNLLHMSTPIHIDMLINGKWIPKDIFPDEFAKIRKEKGWRCRNNNSELTFQEFSDVGPRGNKAFLEDTKLAVLNGNFGPSFNDFINTLIHGNIFLIITARGHEPETMKKFVKWIIYHHMTQEQREKMKTNLKKFQKLFNSDDESIQAYLNTCEFIGVMSEYFKTKFQIEFKGDVEYGKEISIDSFLSRLEKFATQVEAKLKIGFSDDDKNTIKHMTNFFREKVLDVATNYYIFDTSDKGKERVKI
jgi:hypothetical protein